MQQKKGALLAGLSYGGFFLAHWLVLWLAINPRLLFRMFGTVYHYPAFQLDADFFAECFSHAGGALDCAFGFLSQLYYFAWLGALVLTLSGLLYFLLLRYLCKAFGHSLPGFFHLMPALVLLATTANYEHVLYYNLSLILGLLAAWIYVGLFSRNQALALISSALIIGLLFYLAAGSCLVFALVAILHSAVVRKSLPLFLAQIVFAALVPLLMGVFIFDLFFPDYYLFGLPVGWALGGIPAKAWMQFCFLYPFLLMLLAALMGSREQDRPALEAEGFSPKASPWSNPLWSALGGVVLGAVLFLISFNSPNRRVMQFYEWVGQEKWGQILDAAEKLPPAKFSPYINHDVNLALYHSGRIRTRLMDYPQVFPSLLLKSGWPEATRMLIMRKWRLFRDLGDLNRAEQIASETFETYGDSPEVLWNLGVINLAKGEERTARAFFGALEKNLIGRQQARDWIAFMEDGNAPEKRALIEGMQRNMWRVDLVHLGYTEEQLLNGLLTNNPGNRMAMDYLMNWYLLTRKLDEFAANIGRLRAMGYEQLPPIWQDALLIQAARNPQQPPNPYGYKLDPLRVQASENFHRVMQAAYPDAEAAAKQLAPRYGNTYYFYFYFGRSGISEIGGAE